MNILNKRKSQNTVYSRIIYSNLVFKKPQPNDSIQKYKGILNYGFEISGWHNGVKYNFDVCTPVIFHELLMKIIR